MAKRKIWLGPADGANCHPLLIEGPALASYGSGLLLEQKATGLDVSAVSATDFSSETIVSREIASTIEGDIDAVTTIGDTAYGVVARSGEFLNVRVATGQNITEKGTPMSSNGDGQLKIAVVPSTVGATSEQILFYADEIVNVTADQTLVRVRKA